MNTSSLNYNDRQARIAANAAPSRNLERAVVAVAEVLGSGTVEVLVTQSSFTRGIFGRAGGREDGAPNI
jgi:hypothetical protein